MRIGYCSPFNPMKSGISDFSEELVWKLKDHCEIIIFSPVELDNKEIAKTFECHKIADLDNNQLRESLDLIVYHMGNNFAFHGQIEEYLAKYPGIVELHDIALHHFAAEKTLVRDGKDSYLSLVEYCHGNRGVEIAQKFFDGLTGAPWAEQGLNMCMNRYIIDHSTAMIVHSELAKQMVLAIRPEIPVIKIMLHTEIDNDDALAMQLKYRQKYGISEHALVVGSFGYASNEKRIIPCLDALKRFKDTKKEDFLYIIAGKAQAELNIEQQLTDRGLEENVRVTGFTTLEEFKEYMHVCDFCFNLRYPTQGESSASLHRLLGMGKPAIVTDVGSFSEYPDDVVFKVRFDEHEVDDIYDAICLFTAKKGAELKARSKKAFEFAEGNCEINRNAAMYNDFFTQLISGTWQQNYCDIMIDRLCKLGLTDDTYTERISGFLDSLGFL